MSDVPCCSRCKTAPRRKGQRYCFKCHAEDEKQRRRKRKAQSQSDAAIMEQVRAIVNG